MRISLFLILFITVMGCTENVSEQQQESLDALENRYVQFYNEKAEEYLLGTGIEVYCKGQRRIDMDVLRESEWLMNVWDSAFCITMNMGEVVNKLGQNLSDSLNKNCDDSLLKAFVKQRLLFENAILIGSSCWNFANDVQLFQSQANVHQFKIGRVYIYFRNKNGDELKWLERNLDNNCASWKLIAKESLYAN